VYIHPLQAEKTWGGAARNHSCQRKPVTKKASLFGFKLPQEVTALEEALAILCGREGERGKGEQIKQRNSRSRRAIDQGCHPNHGVWWGGKKRWSFKHRGDMQKKLTPKSSNPGGEDFFVKGKTRKQRSQIWGEEGAFRGHSWLEVGKKGESFRSEKKQKR